MVYIGLIGYDDTECKDTFQKLEIYAVDSRLMHLLGPKELKIMSNRKSHFFKLKKNPNNVSRGTVEVLYSITLVL